MSADAQPYILGGERRFLSPASPHVQLVHNPWDDSVVGAVVTAESDAADEAIESARRGFERSRALSSYQRSESLAFITARLRETKEDFARLITAEVGKPIAWSRVEVERAIITFGLASEEAKRMGGDLMPLDLQSGHEDRFGIVRRFPRGIVLCITPFNFPLNLVAHKVAPAIASGNAFILKPAPQAPLTALKLGEIIADSGYPKEAFSILPCANEVAEKMVADLRIHMLSFTGSHSIGWMLKEKAGKKKVVLELGGNAGVIVDGSANVIPAVKKNVVGAFVYAGQVCIKVQRIFVHEDIFDEYRRQFAAEAASAATGDPLNPKTLCGPLIDDKAVVRVRIWLEEAKRSGARVLTGGTFNNRLLAPTVLENVSTTASVYCKEVFAPVVVLQKFQKFEEAVAAINDSEFGLQAGVFSNDWRNILYAYKNIQAGGVVINDNPTFRNDAMPYGGIKNSGLGREGVKYAIEEMTEPKLLVFSP